MSCTIIAANPKYLYVHSFCFFVIELSYTIVHFFNPFPPSVPIWHRLAKLSILILEGIIKKISYDRCDYESVDEKSLSYAEFRKTTKKIQEVKGQTFALADSSDEDCRAYPFPIFVQMIVCLLNEYIKNLTLIVLRIDCPLLELK